MTFIQGGAMLIFVHIGSDRICQSFNKIPLPMTSIQGGAMVIFVYIKSPSGELLGSSANYKCM